MYIIHQVTRLTKRCLMDEAKREQIPPTIAKVNSWLLGHFFPVKQAKVRPWAKDADRNL